MNAFTPLTFTWYSDVNAASHFAGPGSTVFPQGVLMIATSHALKREVNDLVLEQIFAFKERTHLKDRQLLE